MGSGGSHVSPDRAWLVDREEFHKRLAAAMNNCAELARREKIPGSTIRTWASNHGKPVSGGRANVLDNTATLQSGKEPGPISPDDLMRANQLDPADWIVAGVTVNRWDAPGGGVLYQTKVQLRRGRLVLPADGSRSVPNVLRRRKARSTSGKNVAAVNVVLSDQHAGFQCEAADQAVLAFLDEVQPERAILAGDTLDFPKPSRHRETPEWTQSVNDCIQSGHDMLARYVAAAPDTQWDKILGNHDVRIRHAVLDHNRSLYGIRKATTEGTPEPQDQLDIGVLLRLDELGIRLHRPVGEYHEASISLSDTLRVMHGHTTGPSAGTSVLGKVNYSLIFGHTHTQRVDTITRHNADGSRATHLAVQIGCLCRVEGGMGYAWNPSWVQGFAVPVLYADGTHDVELVRIEGGKARWRGKTYG